MGKKFWACALAAALVLPACDGGSSPPVPTTIIVTPGTFTFQALGETVQFAAELRDEAGNPITGTFTFNWTSVNSNVASVSPTGLATARGAGTASITASAEGVTGTATATVDQTPTDLQAAGGDGQTGEAGELLGQQLSVVIFDASGSPVPSKPVTFTVVEGGGSVSSGQVNTNTSGVAATGWTLGSQPGTPQKVRASISGLTVDFSATAAQGILAVKTTDLVDGRQTLSYAQAVQGRGGDGSYTFALESGNVPAGLSFQANGNITGTPTTEGTSNFTVKVTDGTGASATRALSLRVCEAPLTVAPGQIIVRANQPLGACAFFLRSGSNGDRYRIGVLRPSELEDGSTVQMTLTVDADGVQPSPPALAPRTVAALESRLAFGPRILEDVRLAERTEALHLRIRREEAQLVSRLRRRAGAAQAQVQAQVPSPRLAAALQARVDPPANITLKVPTDFGSCTSGASNPATLLGFNDFLAIYQNTSENSTDPVEQANVTRILDYYRDYGDEIITKYLGGVSDINSDGRVTVLVTPNIDAGTAAFVWSGDFFRSTAGGTGLPGICADSNSQEVVYASGSFINSMSGTEPSYQALSTMVHEVKHVSSLYNRASSGFFPLYHPSFIEEGVAEIAGEMSSRLAWAATGGPAVGAEITRQSFAGAPISPESYGIFLRMARVVYYGSSQPNGVSGSPSSQQGGIYGSGLLFHRFLGDAYGGAAAMPLGDQTLFKTQNDPNTAPGYAGLLSVTGKSYLQLLDEFAQAIMMEGTAFEPARSFKTYDFTTATEIFSIPDPAGFFPWPVTKTCNGLTCTASIDSRDPNPDPDDGYVAAAPFQDRSYVGPLGPGGLRIHEFVSNGTGIGAAFGVAGSTGLKTFIARLN